MASREINLLSEKRTISAGELSLRQILKVWTPLVLGVYLFILASSLIATVYLKGHLTRIENLITTERGRIQALEKSEGTYLLLKQKAVVLKQILESRFPYGDIFSYFKNLESSQAKLKSLNLNTAGDLTLNMSVPDSDSMDILFDSLLSDTSRFSRIELQSVILKSSGGFDVSLSVLSNASPSGQEKI